MKPGRYARDARAWVIALALLQGLLTLLLARARYLTVHHHTFDLALYARLAWGLAHGQAWDPILGGGALGGHGSFVLLPLGLLGAPFGTVPVLLVAQSAAIAAAAWPLSRLAARRWGPWAGVLVALAWLLQPNLGHVASYEFHPGTLAVLPLAWAFELLERAATPRTQRALLVLCGLALCCRASLALQTLLLGLVVLRMDAAWRRTGALLFVGSLVWFVLWTASAGFDRASTAAGSSLDQHYGPWGGSPLGALYVLFTAPGVLFDHLAVPARALYPLRVLVPFAFLPLLAPRALLVALPPLALNLLSAFPTATRLDSHYLTPALPPLMWAAILGAERVAALAARRLPRLSGAGLLAPAAMCALALHANAAAGGMPWSADYRARDFQPGRETAARWRALAAIGPAASVQAPDALLPHLAERRGVFRVPPPERAADVVVLDVAHRRKFAHSENLLRTVQEPEVRRWLARPDHQLVYAAGDLLVLQRGRPPRDGVAREYLIGQATVGTGTPLTACLSLLGGELDARAVTLELLANAPCPSDLALRLGTERKPRRVDLLFDGRLSPAQLRAGDRLRSRHGLDPAERAAVERQGLRVGLLRSSGARPERSDPTSVSVALRVQRAPAPAPPRKPKPARAPAPAPPRLPRGP